MRKFVYPSSERGPAGDGQVHIPEFGEGYTCGGWDTPSSERGILTYNPDFQIPGLRTPGRVYEHGVYELASPPPISGEIRTLNQVMIWTTLTAVPSENTGRS